MIGIAVAVPAFILIVIVVVICVLYARARVTGNRPSKRNRGGAFSDFCISFHNLNFAFTCIAFKQERLSWTKRPTFRRMTFTDVDPCCCGSQGASAGCRTEVVTMEERRASDAGIE